VVRCVAQFVTRPRSSRISPPSIPRSFKWYFPLRFRPRILYGALHHAPSHLNLLYSTTPITPGERYKSRSSSVCNYLNPVFSRPPSLFPSHVLLFSVVLWVLRRRDANWSRRKQTERQKRKTLYSGAGNSVTLLQGSQASPVRPSDRSSTKLKTLEWLEQWLERRTVGS
jgi:hypothetical protein